MQFHNTELGNGLQIIGEINPSVQSVAVGFFVRTGSRDESDEVSGVSHFLEHMAFKGDEKLSADDINRVFDEVGARYNASTSEEITLFYAAILPEYLERTFELLSVLLQPSLRQEDFDMEKKVILEEIGMYQDQPSFTAYENLMQIHFKGHSLSRCILGTEESIQELTSEQMKQYHQDHYKAGNILLAFAGNADWDEMVKLAEKYCGNIPAGSHDRNIAEAEPKSASKIVTKVGSVQQHVMQMEAAPNAKDDKRFAAEILSVIVGDDGGSRFYWELVDPGHAEAAEMGYNEYDGSGTYMTYLSCEPDETKENLSRIKDIYEEVNNEGVTEEELSQAKNKVASRIVLRGERPMGRLSSLGGNWVYRQEYNSIEDDINTVRSITLEDIKSLLKKYPLGQLTTTTIGPLESL
jgi:predicted Zn-dependent peptidase